MDVEVSIIIPAYNVEDYISDTLESCLKQENVKIEIIVVNDGSTDTTSKIIQTYSHNGENIIYINKPNGGVTSAREAGLKIAKGEYIFFLDGDDRIPDKSVISTMFNKAVNAEADFVVGDFNIIFPDGKVNIKTFPLFESYDSKEALKYALRFGDFYYTGRLIKRKLVADIMGEIPTEITYGEDNYAIVKILAGIKKSIKIDIPVLDYIQRSNSVTNKLNKSDFERRNEAINLTLISLEELHIDSFAFREMTLYALRELAMSISMGCPNTILADKYLRRYRVMNHEDKKNLGTRSNLILKSALLSLPLTIFIARTLRMLK